MAIIQTKRHISQIEIDVCRHNYLTGTLNKTLFLHVGRKLECGNPSERNRCR